MGGPASGRTGGRRTVEGSAAVVLDLNQMLALRAGQDPHCTVWDGVRGGPFRIFCDVRLPAHGLGALTIRHEAFAHVSCVVPAADYSVVLEPRPWRFGGRRWFLLCPNTGRRVLKLYLPDGSARFTSRHALGLGYRSQRVDQLEEAHARLARLHAKLGGRYRSFRQSAPPRPKRMRHVTYRRLVGEMDQARDAFVEVYLGGLRRLMAAEDAARSEAR